MPIDYNDPQLKANIEGKYITFDTIGQEVRGQIISSELKRWQGGAVNPEYNLRLLDGSGDRFLAAGTRDLKAQCFDLRLQDGDLLLVRFERQDPPKGTVEGAKYFFVQAFRNGVQLQPEQKQAAWAGAPAGGNFTQPQQPAWSGQPQPTGYSQSGPSQPPAQQGGPWGPEPREQFINTYGPQGQQPQQPAAQPAWSGNQGPAQPAYQQAAGPPQPSFEQTVMQPQQPVQQAQVPGMPPAQPATQPGNGQLSQQDLDALASAGLTAPPPY